MHFRIRLLQLPLLRCRMLARRVCSSQSVNGSGYIHRTSSDTAHTSQEIISADPLGVSTSLSAPYTVAGLLKTIAGTDSTNSWRLQLVQTLYRRG